MNSKTAKALRRKSVENVKKLYGTVTAILCQQEYSRLKKELKSLKSGK